MEDYDGEIEALTPLHEAVEAGNLVRVQALIAAGADIEEKQYLNFGSRHEEGVATELEDMYQDHYGVIDEATPLYRAAWHGHLEVAFYLVKRGANKEAVDENGGTPLLAAAREGHNHMVELLIKLGANKDAVDDENLTALLWAAIHGNGNTMKYLLEQGCDVDHVSNNGNTAFHFVAEKRDYRANHAHVQLFFSWGAKLDVRNNNWKLAVELADHDIVELIRVEELRLSKKMHEAVEVGDLSRVQAFVAAGDDIEERLDGDHHKQYTPLNLAAEKGRVAMVRYLIESGADKEAVDLHCRKSLCIAAAEGHIDVVRIFIEHGADKEAADDEGATALMWSASAGHAVVVEYLLEQGCNVDCVDTYGSSSLHQAAERGHFEIAQLLLRYGANLDLRDKYGRTAADVATSEDHDDIADAIRAEEIRRRDHGFKRDRSTIEGTEEHEASKRPRVEREAEEAAAAAAAAESDDDDDDEDDEEEEGS